MNIVENPTPDFERQFVLAINARRKLKGNKPKFVITSNQVTSSNEENNSNQVILTVKSIQTLLLNCHEKSSWASNASWCKILRARKLQQTLVIVLNGVTDKYYQQLKETEQFEEWKQFFTSENICHQFRFHTQKNIPLIEQFSKIAAKSKSTNPSEDRSLLQTKAEQLSKRKRSVDEEEDLTSQVFNKSGEDQFSRVNLVLNFTQLLTGNYPCPIYNQFRNFKQLKSSYQPVTSSSKIFALDVETFSDLIENQQIPYWLSIVDESLSCVYQTLIKPANQQHLVHYQQRQEQVTKLVPKIIERTLEEVHHDLKELLADDSILAGHSIENDLKYLQFYYPYLIDTSIIFNISGNRLEKASLQKLYAVFFGRLIQKVRLEHDPTEDARATMELIQLKLSKNIQFGDWFLGGVDQLQVLGNFDSVQLNEDLEQCQTFLVQTKFGLQEDFFKKLKNQHKTVLIDQTSNSPKSLPTVLVDSNRQAFKACSERMTTHEFLWLQFHLDNEESFSKIIKYIKKLYAVLREDSVLIGIFSGNESYGRCFVRMKDDQKLTPLIIDGKEYPHDLKLTKSNV